MARQVTNIQITEEGATDNSYVAMWRFTDPEPHAIGSNITGVWVKIKSGAKYYNGTDIPADVQSDIWIVTAHVGDKCTLGVNYSHTKPALQASVRQKDLDAAFGISPSLQGTTDHFAIQWYYDGGNGVFFKGTSEDVPVDDNGAGTGQPRGESTYSPPSGAIGVKIKVTPVAKTRKVNNKDVAYWTGTAASATYYFSMDRPEKPSTPTVEIDGYQLTVSVENISDPLCDQIQFAIFNDTEKINQATARVISRRASYTCTVSPGGRYRALCRAMNVVGTGATYSDWTDLSSAVLAVPSVPTLNTVRASSSTSAYLEWSSVDSAESYDIEYTTNVNYFDNSNATTVVNGIEFNHYELTGLETGDEYFFRVRAVNEKGESGWSEIKSTAIGKKPTAPTTWSSSTTVVTGEQLILYWVHNAADGSNEYYAEVEVTIGGEKTTETIRNETADDPEAEQKTRSYSIDTSLYAEGTKVQWRVRTAGVTLEYGDWSIMREVDIYAPPTLTLNVTNQNGEDIETLTGFPFFIKGLAGPNTQEPISYNVTITADSGYETVDEIGRNKTVNPGDVVYTTHVDTKDPLLLEMLPSNIDLESGITYTITVIVSMNSGLTATATSKLTVIWSDEQYFIECSIGIDEDLLVAYISPYCYDENEQNVENVTLSVYRREFDGTFTEIATGIDSTKSTVVMDPHPALDYARYRIVAISNLTGAISFYDPPGYPVDGNSTVIQWDEVWSDFEMFNEDSMADQPWSGSMLKLPYNIQVSDEVDPESKLVKYAGREYPTSYYGTSIDSSSTWKMDVPKTDVETLYSLRRLSIWRGDVYVREPSGSGYWANIKVSYDIKYDSLVIPVTLKITRVEGGA